MNDASSDIRRDAVQMSGTMIVVVGPSGAGKDTLIDYAAQRLCHRSDVHFVRRVITRDSDAGGEAHEGVTTEEFERRRASGAFCVSWDAHGLSYGIPMSVKDQIQAGHIAIANGSRNTLANFQKTFAKLVIVNIVASPQILAARLAVRGREDVSEISRRLERKTGDLHDNFDVVTIDNSGDIATAGAAFLDVIESHLRP